MNKPEPNPFFRRSVLHRVIPGVLAISMVCVVPEAMAQFQRTLIVGGQPTPQANGVALNAALASITTNSATNPWLIRLEPGVFDLQTGSLSMKDFVDIEGSGRDVSSITSTSSFLSPVGATVDVPPGVNAELRNLTVRNTGPNTSIAVANQSDFFLLTQVNLEVESQAGARGLWTTGSAPRISEVFARVTSTGANSVGALVIGGAPVISEMFVLVSGAGNDNKGFKIEGGAFATLLEVRASVDGGVLRNRGINLQSGSRAEIQNCNILVGGSASSSDNRGFYLQAGTSASAKDCLVRVVNGDSAYGSWTEGATVVFRQSTLVASSAASTNVGVYNRGGGSTTLQGGGAEGATASVQNATAGDTSTIGASQLIGPPSAVAGSVLVCAQAYDGAFAELNTLCQ